MGRLQDKFGNPVFAKCLECGTKKIRAGRIEDEEFLPVDHFICENCGFRWLVWKGHLWVLVS